MFASVDLIDPGFKSVVIGRIDASFTHSSRIINAEYNFEKIGELTEEHSIIA